MNSIQDENQIRLNLLGLFAAHVRELSEEEDDREEADLLLQVTETYADELEGQMKDYRSRGTIEYLSRLKDAVRAANTLVNWICQNRADDIAGWSYGCRPTNTVQRIHNLLWEACLELTKTILKIEALYPEFSHYFKIEREIYWEYNQ
jgi:hypothetical protein